MEGFLQQNVYSREEKGRFLAPKSRKFPVFFPVSSKSWRRRVSARLRAPPELINPNHLIAFILYCKVGFSPLEWPTLRSVRRPQTMFGHQPRVHLFLQFIFRSP